MDDDHERDRALPRAAPVVLVVDSCEGGSGTVQVQPPDAICTNTPGTTQNCDYGYAPGTVVTLEALPSSDSVFVGWVGSCEGTQPTCPVTMDQVKGVARVFRGPQRLLVMAESFENGAGAIRITPPNEYCANTPGTRSSASTCTAWGRR